MFSSTDLDHVAELAHLHLGDGEKAELLVQIQDVLAHVQALNELDLTGVSSSALSGETPLRKDEISRAFPVDLKLNAPAFEQHAFAVPKILE